MNKSCFQGQPKDSPFKRLECTEPVFKTTVIIWDLERRQSSRHKPHESPALLNDLCFQPFHPLVWIASIYCLIPSEIIFVFFLSDPELSEIFKWPSAGFCNGLIPSQNTWSCCWPSLHLKYSQGKKNGELWTSIASFLSPLKRIRIMSLVYLSSTLTNWIFTVM